VLVLAHRGAPTSVAAENTVPAVLAALRHGADGVEVDLRLTADGVLTVTHDADLRRVAGLPLVVARSRWGPLRDAAVAAGHALARVEDVAVAAGAARLVLELKPAPSARDRTAQALADAVLRLRRADLAHDVVVSSFDAELLLAVRRRSPVRTALLGEAWDPLGRLVRRALSDGHAQVHPYHRTVGPEGVAAAHAVGVAVVPWTVNGHRPLARVLRSGVDAVITDEPVRARRELAGRSRSA
jgi:glycerophosphoryl diester phosphodiesterase